MIKTKQERFDSYEVYDDRGHSVGRVVLPRQSRFVGTSRGTVYLRRQALPKARSGSRAA